MGQLLVSLPAQIPKTSQSPTLGWKHVSISWCFEYRFHVDAPAADSLWQQQMHSQQRKQSDQHNEGQDSQTVSQTVSQHEGEQQTVGQHSPTEDVRQAQIDKVLQAFQQTDATSHTDAKRQASIRQPPSSDSNHEATEKLRGSCVAAAATDVVTDDEDGDSETYEPMEPAVAQPEAQQRKDERRGQQQQTEAGRQPQSAAAATQNSFVDDKFAWSLLLVRPHDQTSSMSGHDKRG